MRWCVPARLALVGLAVLLTLSPGAAAQQAQQTRSLTRFVKAQDQYERQMDAVRQGVLAALERASEAARSRKGADAAEVRRLADERDAFLTKGEWPTVSGIPGLRRQAAAAARAMDKAYSDAIDTLLKEKQDHAAAEFQSRRDMFRNENDLPPWGEDLVAGKPTEMRTVGDGREPLRAIAPDSPHFRVEVVARPLDAPAGIVLEYTSLGEPKTRDSEASSAAQTLVVTLERDPQSGFAQVIQIGSSGGPMIVERLRLKPVPDGSIADLGPEPAERDTGRGKERQTVADLMPRGSVWRGTVTHNQQGRFQTRMEVVSSGPDEVVLRGTWVREITLEFQFRARGASLTLVGVRELSKTGGTRAGCSGSGRVRGGKLTTTYAWRVSGGDLQKQAVSGSMTLERE